MLDQLTMLKRFTRGLLLKRVFTEFSSKSGLFESSKRHVSVADIVTIDLVYVSAFVIAVRGGK